MDETTKQTLLAQLASHLDAIEGGIEIDAEAPDLFTLLAELAALKNEVKLESRQVKEALDGFRGLLDQLGRANRQLEAELGRRREEEAQRLAEAGQDVLLDLLDLRDRLAAGHEQARQYRPGWLARRSGAAGFVAALEEGQAMSLTRLEEILSRRGIQAIVTEGQAFDARLMHAVGTQWDEQRPVGQVIEQVRAGYRLGDRLLRAAEVVVNKKL